MMAWAVVEEIDWPVDHEVEQRFHALRIQGASETCLTTNATAALMWLEDALHPTKIDIQTEPGGPSTIMVSVDSQAGIFRGVGAKQHGSTHLAKELFQAAIAPYMEADKRYREVERMRLADVIRDGTAWVDARQESTGKRYRLVDHANRLLRLNNMDISDMIGRKVSPRHLENLYAFRESYERHYGELVIEDPTSPEGQRQIDDIQDLAAATKGQNGKKIKWTRAYVAGEPKSADHDLRLLYVPGVMTRRAIERPDLVGSMKVFLKMRSAYLDALEKGDMMVEADRDDPEP